MALTLGLNPKLMRQEKDYGSVWESTEKVFLVPEGKAEFRHVEELLRWKIEQAFVSTVSRACSRAAGQGLSRVNVGSMLLHRGLQANTGHSTPCLGIALVTKKALRGLMGLACLFPCPTSRPRLLGSKPQPNRSCLAPGPEVAREARKTKKTVWFFEAFWASQVEGGQGGSSW